MVLEDKFLVYHSLFQGLLGWWRGPWSERRVYGGYDDPWRTGAKMVLRSFWKEVKQICSGRPTLEKYQYWYPIILFFLPLSSLLTSSLLITRVRDWILLLLALQLPWVLLVMRSKLQIPWTHGRKSRLWQIHFPCPLFPTEPYHFILRIKIYGNVTNWDTILCHLHLAAFFCLQGRRLRHYSLGIFSVSAHAWPLACDMRMKERLQDGTLKSSPSLYF